MEIWKDIQNYEGLYMVSNKGRIKSLSTNLKFRKGNSNELIMKQSKSSTGYLHVQLYKNKKSSTKLIHILVASAFIDNPNNKPQVNHKDGNKQNNNASNLEWVTRSENQRHSYAIGLATPNMIGRSGAKSPVCRAVKQYSLDGNFIRSWECISDAARYIGTNPKNICECLSGRNKTCKSFVWKYKE